MGRKGKRQGLASSAPALLVALGALAIAAYSQFPALAGRYVIADDARQAVYWMEQFRDPGLFQGDLLSRYARHYVTPGVKLLYRAACLFAPPLAVSKLLPLLLLPLCAWYAFILGERLGGRLSGLLAGASLAMAPHFLLGMVGGLPRAFATLCLLAFIYHLLAGQERRTAAALLAACLFYPMAGLACLPVYALAAWRRFRARKGRRRDARRLLLPAGALLCCLLALGAVYLPSDPDLGKPVDREAMAGKPEYYGGLGRYPVLPTPSLARSALAYLDDGAYPLLACSRPVEMLLGEGAAVTARLLLAAALLFLLYREARAGRLRAPWPLAWLALSSLAMFVLADLFLLRLFLPERYLRYPLPLVSLLVSSLGMALLLRKPRAGRPRTAAAVGVAALMLLSFDARSYRGLGLMDASYQQGLCEHLATLPADALVAAHPVLADGIPTFARRAVFVKYELAHPFYDRYWQEVKRRTFALFDALYAEERATLRAFCRENGVDYLVVDARHYSPAFIRRGQVYFEPFNSYVLELWKRRKRFALAEVASMPYIYRDGELYVLDANSL